MDDYTDEEKDEIHHRTSGLSTSFTISFEDESEKTNVIKQKRIIKTANMFTKKHYRTLSLPVANNCFLPKNNTSKYGCESDPKEALSNGKDYKAEICSSQCKAEESNGVAICEDVKSQVFGERENSNYRDTSVHTSDKRSMDNGLSDTESEGGTYTIDKNNEQVKQARKSIDQVFGISSENQNDVKILVGNKQDKRSRMIDEWIEQSVSALKTTPNETPRTPVMVPKSDTIKVRTTRIPFPIEKSRELGSTNSLNGLIVKSTNTNVNGNLHNNVISEPKKKMANCLSNDEETDTEQYLRETENIVTAIQKRIRNDMKPLRLDDVKTRCTQSERESTPSKYSNTRFNRAFSLRRDRLKKPSPTVTSTTIPVRSKTFIGTATAKTSLEHTPSRSISNIKRNNSFCKDYLKSDNDTPKTKQSLRMKQSSNSVARKNTKSSQEIELHNWKRRKNYDPMKAVAEEKRKKALAGIASNSVSSAHLKKECNSLEESDDLAAKIITRSASFHGLRNKNGYEIESPPEIPIDKSASHRSISSYFMASNDDAADYENDSEDHWVIPKPPSTSLQNTPPESLSSRLSLLSNAASNSSAVLMTSSVNTKVDSTTVLKVTQLSYKIKDTLIALADSVSESGENIFQNVSVSLKDQSSYLSSQKSIYDRGSTEGVDDLCDDNSGENEDISFADNNDLSADYQLNIALSNLNEIYQAVQKLQLNCAK